MKINIETTVCNNKDRVMPTAVWEAKSSFKTFKHLLFNSCRKSEFYYRNMVRWSVSIV